MTGFLPVYKPAGPTSHTVTKKVGRLLNEKSAGHSGTLDPMAIGVLLVMLGRAAKLLDYLPSDKSYKAVLKLGVKTDTGDITGNVTEEKSVNVKMKDVINIFPEFIGEISQLPPMYSAIKSDGLPLYEYARRGIEIERKTRKIKIYSIELTDYNEENNTYEIDVSCSKGTYIRTLCEDIGEKLSCGATMVSLERTKSNGIDLKDCHSLEQIEKAVFENKTDDIIISPEKMFNHLPKAIVPDDGKKFYQNGGCISARRFNTTIEEELYRVYDSGGIFLGLGGKGPCGNDIGLKSVWQLEISD